MCSSDLTLQTIHIPNRTPRQTLRFLLQGKTLEILSLILVLAKQGDRLQQSEHKGFLRSTATNDISTDTIDGRPSREFIKQSYNSTPKQDWQEGRVLTKDGNYGNIRKRMGEDRYRWAGRFRDRKTGQGIGNIRFPVSYLPKLPIDLGRTKETRGWNCESFHRIILSHEIILSHQLERKLRL